MKRKVRKENLLDDSIDVFSGGFVFLRVPWTP